MEEWAVVDRPKDAQAPEDATYAARSGRLSFIEKAVPEIDSVEASAGCKDPVFASLWLRPFLP